MTFWSHLYLHTSSLKTVQIMLTQTCLRAYCAARLCPELRTVSAVGSLSSSPSSLSNSSSTLMTRRETRRGHYVVQRRWWLPYIPNIDDMSKYPYDEHAPGKTSSFVIVKSHEERALPLFYVLSCTSTRY